jgi:hypothetical protein
MVSVGLYYHYAVSKSLRSLCCLGYVLSRLSAYCAHCCTLWPFGQNLNIPSGRTLAFSKRVVTISVWQLPEENVWTRDQFAAGADTGSVTVEFSRITGLPCRTGATDGHYRSG